MRVNIEYELFSDTRLRKLARLLKWEEPKAAGYLLYLWFNSQKEHRHTGTLDEILEWSYLEEHDEWVDYLVTARLLICHGLVEKQTQYEIVGNKKQIDAVLVYKEKKRKAGKARAEKAKRLSDGRFSQVRQTGITDPAPAGEIASAAQQVLSTAGDVLVDGRAETSHSTSLHSISSHSISLQKGEHSSPKEIAGTLSIPKSWQKKINEFDRDMGARWFARAKQKLPNGRFNEDKFVLAIAKMRGNFDLDEKQIQFIFDWVEQDEFWCRNAISPDSLLKKSKSNPDITKLEQVVMALHHRKKSRTEKEIEAVQKVSKKYDSPSKALSVFLEAAK